MPGQNPEKKPTPRNPELRIYGVPNPVHDGLINISDNLGICLSDMMKPHLRKVMESYPEHLRQPKPKD